MEELYLEVFCEPQEGGLTLVSLETAITLFLVKYCNEHVVHLILVVKPHKIPSFKVKLLGLNYELLHSENDAPKAVRSCLLPVILMGEDITCVAGLCAVLRQVIKSILGHKPGHWSQSLLGFRQGCLMACAESSVWTRFCEVDIIKTVNELVLSDIPTNEVSVPEDVARFEIHMAQPIRVHNVYKNKPEHSTSKNGFQGNSVDNSCGKDILFGHCYAEGWTITLADIILLPCFHIILESLKSVYLQQYLPLTVKWYKQLLMQDGLEDALSIIREISPKIVDDLYVVYKLADVPKQSLYKSDPKRYKPKNRIFTRQEDIDASLQVVAELGLTYESHSLPFGSDVQFDWHSLPYDAQPEGGHLPPSRRERKSQQLENLAKAVLKVARPGHTVVDFCSGSGHLGIVLAHLLPRCEVVLLENKEESLTRARHRVQKLKLSNVSFYQCNLDYFTGKFNIGTSLHACGVATDLVIKRCIQQRAVFVSCPCCYGSVENNHIITYPRSQHFRNSSMTLREYLVLGHSADQTHDANNVKTDQGKKCMGIIDKDRCLQASEAGYIVSLAKLIPESCTPKNNLLVGIPKEWYEPSEQYL
ncbi:glutathione S-transferase C-terminal domain-containing protein homolog [Anabrus simplex]|uniref:glutathione S-transferase C-terminal domain-containing protein homolog n=1 Tax=Anabrus simplex TaxID=316456 RepID=UPI0035A2EDC2